MKNMLWKHQEKQTSSSSGNIEVRVMTTDTAESPVGKNMNFVDLFFACPKRKRT
jgi:hypothetical protein